MGTLIANTEVNWQDTRHRVLNVSTRYDLAGTLRYGLDLFPQTRRLVLVAGVGRTQATLPAQLAQALSAQHRQLEIEDTSALPYAAMMQRIATLPPDSLVVVADYFRDSTGHPYVPAEVATEVSRRANVPALGLFDVHIKAGLLGGSAVNSETVGQRAGEIGFELLQGVSPPQDGDPKLTVAHLPIFNWPQLQKWDANPAKLPANTLFLNRPRTLWSEYRAFSWPRQGRSWCCPPCFWPLPTKTDGANRLKRHCASTSSTLKPWCKNALPNWPRQRAQPSLRTRPRARSWPT